MGFKIETDDKGVKVIRKDGTSKAGNAYTMYSLMYSFKQGDDWKNVFIECSFRRGVDLANKTKIKITNAFMTGSEYNGQTKPKIFVLDFEVVEPGEGQPAKAPDTSFMSIPDNIGDELPFH